ncbi:phosphoribosyltransferase-like protein [Caproicibacterium amylolyticum]|uniref:PRTase-CE domain-containing protein n=1 Tax=Caproicibacterium amylolyticum TaxID=2766537 RepID=A0A7G9WG65_9FIRM|nr:hypothetical protein [Caproicibacterium amylolyticum]QNO17677.1 hypothetical protein H6X83_12220 [Caproicibacterium amylolyticum]
MRKGVVPNTSGLSIQTFGKIKSIFNQKNWPIDGYFHECFFDEFCKLMQELDDQQQDTILSLTEEFVWVRDSEYIKYFSAVFHKLIVSLDISKHKNIFICPLLPEENFGESKSSVALYYVIKSNLISIQNQYNEFNIVGIDAPQSFDSSKFSEKSILCLIDDFIGSGETSNIGAQFFTQKKGIEKSKIIILSLIAMQQGIDFLQGRGYTVFATNILQKGITGRKDGNENKYRTAMKKIENMINVKSKYEFGYSQSEALVKMMHTPNNTFPVYWLKNKKNPHAPFPR